jgi:LmbE family N-acetylglucosaminyl deacetylase
MKAFFASNWKKSAKHRARMALHSAMMSAMRTRAHNIPIEDAPSCIVFAPHEDDATLGCGGLILRRRLDGNQVDVVNLTDGSASHPKHPTLDPRALGAQRRSEELAAARTLGVDLSRVHFMDARDGTLDRLGPAETDSLVGRIAGVLGLVRPQEVFLPCRRDGSSEHDAAFILVQHAIARAGLCPRLFEYPIWSLWAPQRLVRPFITSRGIWKVEFAGYEHLKLRALSSYRSQVLPTPPWNQPVLSPEFVSLFLSPEEFFFEMGAS